MGRTGAGVGGGTGFHPQGTGFSSVVHGQTILPEALCGETKWRNRLRLSPSTQSEPAAARTLGWDGWSRGSGSVRGPCLGSGVWGLRADSRRTPGLWLCLKALEDGSVEAGHQCFMRGRHWWRLPAWFLWTYAAGKGEAAGMSCSPVLPGPAGPRECGNLETWASFSTARGRSWSDPSSQLGEGGTQAPRGGPCTLSCC